MRRLLKSFTAFSVIAMLLFSFCISVGAVEETHNSQDGLVASITTKKDGYQSNEDIDQHLKLPIPMILLLKMYLWKQFYQKILK